MWQFVGCLMILLLSSIPLTAQPVSDEGLVAYYPFLGNAQDYSGNGHHGTVDGAILTENRFGAADRAYYFSSCTLISFGDPADNSFDIAEEVTLSAWVSMSSPPPSQGSNIAFSVIGKDIWNGPNVSKWILGLQQNRLIFHINGPGYGSGYWIYSVSQPLALDTWYHIALTKIGTVYAFYLNGALLNSEVMTPAVYDVAAPLTIGCAEPSSPHHGDIDEVRFYNRTLASEEIMALYEGPGNPMQLSITYNDGAVSLEWAEVDDADYYRVYSSNNPYSDFIEDLSGTFDGVSWVAAPVTAIRFYRIRAVRL